MATHTTTYTRTHTATFVTDKLRNVLRDIVRLAGLDPTNLIDDWETLGRGIRTWLETGDLQKVTLEFNRPGSSAAAARWDIPIEYDGNGVPDDMWVDQVHLRATLAKANQPPKDSKYRVVLTTRPGRPDVDGFCTTSFRSTDGLVVRNTGTVIATGDIMASLAYWRSA